MSLYLGENLISGQTTLVGESRNIGQIIPSAIPLTDAGLHLLDGALIQGSGIYSAFVDYIAGLDLTANYFCTEAEWQQSISDYGVCGKFVYDSVNNTVRLPKYNSKIYTGGGTAPVIGNGLTLGLTNGTDDISIIGKNYHTPNFGSYSGQNVSTSNLSESYFTGSIGVTKDPTKSGLIAQLSNITTSLDGYYYIIIATSTKTDIQVDIDEIATDLNGKVDKSSLQEVQCVVETYVNGTSWYRVYSDGWCEQGGRVPASSQTVNFLKPYTDTNYTVTGGLIPGTTSATYEHLNIGSLTTTGFYYTAYDGYQLMWQVCGYIEV